MNYMKPPTDNLYKFMAIAGLVFLGYSNYFWQSSNLDVELKVIAATAKGQLLALEKEDLNLKISEMVENQKIDKEYFKCLKDNKSKVKAIKKLYDFCLSKHKVTKNEIKARHELTNDMYDKTLALHRQLAKKSIAYEKEFEIIKLLNSKLSKYTNIVFALMSASLLLIFWGFYFWYTRVQKPQDKLLKKEIIKSKSS